jgi:hypothetical protein
MYIYSLFCDYGTHKQLESYSGEEGTSVNKPSIDDDDDDVNGVRLCF